MEILKERTYQMVNLVSKSGKFKVDDFQSIVMEMSNAFKDKAIENGEYIITTTKIIEDEGRILDVEILIPVTDPIEVEEPYIYKDKIKIVNALYIKIIDVNLLSKAMNRVNEYIVEHQLLATTSAYLVQTKENDQPCIEIYIGISQNIL